LVELGFKLRPSRCSTTWTTPLAPKNFLKLFVSCELLYFTEKKHIYLYIKTDYLKIMNIHFKIKIKLL
jgi:hypothetical protein